MAHMQASIRERFAALSASLTSGGRASPSPDAYLKKITWPRPWRSTRLTADEAYVDYLAPHSLHLFRSARAAQAHSRKYVGVVLAVGGHDYFAPLSSFKDKHRRIKNGLDFVKVKDMAVVNLNNMFPVPVSCCQRVDFVAERDRKYRALLQAEYRAMKPLQDRIHKNARTLYSYKLKYGNSTRLVKCRSDFAALERLCDAYGK